MLNFCDFIQVYVFTINHHHNKKFSIILRNTIDSKEEQEGDLSVSERRRIVAQSLMAKQMRECRN